ncbi:sensor histidine kinase KdpD [Niveispirillum sp. BGYR6]|uniref:sensor histidine kinase KdpD n=1 Tax=Niveispirillum sp. BGYR6 TaxID=2971249 RepID=UPI00325FC71B
MTMAPADADRPNPDALLEQANREKRGRLKIFLGAAPGVGKTYAMLEAAQAVRRDGGDVVIGIVETHGRAETERLVAGLEVLPRARLDYRGRAFQEMDLDAILIRRPKLVLVDELAHTNIPGSRHLRRWQDVEELLGAGIDVWSTLNVQHLESLNDIVERIAGIKVRETLPDSVLRAADEIEMVDLPPPELRQRLAEGKVYVPAQAQRAAEKFFSIGNLTALREMALRQAAERVDAQMLSYMRSHGIAGPWPTRDRILVAIPAAPLALRLVRAAKRMAERRQMPWTVAHVETHRHANLSDADKAHVTQAFRLTQQLGGEIAALTGDDITGELLGWARANNVSQIVLGRTRRTRRLFGRSLTGDMLKRASDHDILLVGGVEEEARASGQPQRPPAAPLWTGWKAYAWSALAVGVASLISWGVYTVLPVGNVSLVYLLAVLLIATRFGLVPSVITALVAFFAFNYLFTEPRYTFSVSDSDDLLTIGFFLVAAIFTGQLASRLRRQIEVTRTSQRRTANLYDFSRKVSSAASEDDVLWAVVHHVAATLKAKVLILLPDGGDLSIRAGYPPEDTLDQRAAAAALWAWGNGQRAGRGSQTLPAADWLFLPLRTQRGTVGVMGVQMDGADGYLSTEQERLLDTLSDQAALALERTQLVQDIEAAQVAQEKEQLRAALLSSLSHDLRTPLVSILGAATSLITYEEALDRSARLELTQTIQEEAERLNRFVQNLLDMTRLGSGGLKPKTDWVDLADIIGRALARARPLLKGHKVKVDLAPGLPLLQLDPVLMEQVFFNLLDNAAKYSPAGTAITVWARRQGAQVTAEICDQGPGIPPADQERVFDMFYRVQQGDKQTAGTGLGLAIAKGLVEAHGGTIGVMSGIHGVGASLVVRLPIPEGPPAAAPETE